MSAGRRLLVSSNGRPMGSLSAQDDIWTFEYFPAWQQATDAYPLSPAFPLAQGVHRDGSTERKVQWFFDNLLPEDMLRDVVSREESVRASDAFGLLERLGAESAGALVLLPPGSAEAARGSQALSRASLSARIQNLPRASLTAASPKRMSLAGAQHKMVLLFDAATQSMREPLKGTASSHILKPNAQSAQYPHSVANETFTMRLAQRLGLDVPSVYRLYLPEPVYVVERFDRLWDAASEEFKRRHVMDGCQLLGLAPNFKYSRATLQTLMQLIGLCRNKAAARLSLFRWVLFNTLVGNSDSHLKNISFLADHEGVQVAPCYDLLCTAVYHTRMYADDAAIWPQEPLAISVVDAAVFADVTQGKLVRTGQALGLSRAAAQREVTKMMATLPDAADQLETEMLGEFDALAQGENATALQATRGAEAHLLRGIRHNVIADMVRRVR